MAPKPSILESGAGSDAKHTVQEPICGDDDSEEMHHCLVHTSTSPRSGCESCSKFVEQQRLELLCLSSQAQPSADILLPSDSSIGANEPKMTEGSVGSRTIVEDAKSGNLINVNGDAFEAPYPVGSDGHVDLAVDTAVDNAVHDEFAVVASPLSDDNDSSKGGNSSEVVGPMASDHRVDLDECPTTVDNSRIKTDSDPVKTLGTAELHSPAQANEDSHDDDDLWGSEGLPEPELDDDLPRADNSLAHVLRDMARAAAEDKGQTAERNRSLNKTVETNDELAVSRKDAAASENGAPKVDNNNLVGVGSSAQTDSATATDGSQNDINDRFSFIRNGSNGFDNPPLSSAIHGTDKAASQPHTNQISGLGGHAGDNEDKDEEILRGPGAAGTGSDMNLRDDAYQTTKQSTAQVNELDQTTTSKGTKRQWQSSNNLLTQTVPSPKRSRVESDPPSIGHSELTTTIETEGETQFGEQDHAKPSSSIEALLNQSQHDGKASQRPLHFPGYQHIAPVPLWGWFYDLNGSSLVNRGTHPGWRRDNHQRGQRCDEVHGCYPGSNCQRPTNARSCMVCHNIWATKWDRYFQDQARLPRHVDVSGPGPDGVDPRMDYIGFLNEDLKRHRANP